MDKEKERVMRVPHAPSGEIANGTAHSLLRFADIEKPFIIEDEATDGFVLVAIERDKDGWYWLYTIENIPCNINGYGKTLEEARKCFMQCYEDLKKELGL